MQQLIFLQLQTFGTWSALLHDSLVFVFGGR